MVPVLGHAIKPLLILPAHCGQHGEFGFPKSTSGQERGNLPRRLRARCQHQEPHIGLNKRNHLLNRAAMHRQRFNIRQGPSHARRGELKCRKLRMVDDLARVNRLANPRAENHSGSPVTKITARRPRRPLIVAIIASKGDGHAMRSAFGLAAKA